MGVTAMGAAAPRLGNVQEGVMAQKYPPADPASRAQVSF